jgi:hypothetical protein
MHRMFRSYSESSYRCRLDWLGNYRTCFYSPIGFILSVHTFSRSDLLNVAIGFFQPILKGT